MIKAHNVVILVSWALLSAAPWILAQDEKPTEVRAIGQRPVAIQELGFQPQRLFRFPLLADPVSTPMIVQPDLSRYREFQFGMNLLAVAMQTGMKPAEARTIHKRPALIQELKWQPQHFLGASSLQTEPSREFLFSFYNGELFRIVTNYDRGKTEGLTDEDMIDAISAKYGAATRPMAKNISFSSQGYDQNEKLVASWEDAQYSFNLFRSSYQPTFGMIAFSKRLDTLARAAIVEAIRLDELEAPQREIERQKKETDEAHAEQEKARLVNKPNFRP
jgi:hypothetical protein